MIHLSWGGLNPPLARRACHVFLQGALNRIVRRPRTGLMLGRRIPEFFHEERFNGAEPHSRDTRDQEH